MFPILCNVVCISGGGGGGGGARQSHNSFRPPGSIAWYVVSLTIDPIIWGNRSIRWISFYSLGIGPLVGHWGIGSLVGHRLARWASACSLGIGSLVGHRLARWASARSLGIGLFVGHRPVCWALACLLGIGPLFFKYFTHTLVECVRHGSEYV